MRGKLETSKKGLFETKGHDLMREGRFAEVYLLILKQLGPGVHGYLRAGTGSELHGDELYDALRLALWEHLPDHRPVSIVAWVYTVARNALIDWRRRYSRNHVRLASFVEHEDASPGPRSLLEQREREARIAALLAELTDNELDAYILRAERNLSYREIGEVIGTSEDAARMSCYRARERLKTLIKQGQRWEP